MKRKTNKQLEELQMEFGKKFTFLDNKFKYKVGYVVYDEVKLFGPLKMWNFIKKVYYQAQKDYEKQKLSKV